MVETLFFWIMGLYEVTNFGLLSYHFYISVWRGGGAWTYRQYQLSFLQPCRPFPPFVNLKKSYFWNFTCKIQTTISFIQDNDWKSKFFSQAPSGVTLKYLTHSTLAEKRVSLFRHKLFTVTDHLWTSVWEKDFMSWSKVWYSMHMQCHLWSLMFQKKTTPIITR